MAKIVIDNQAGMIPRVEKRLLPGNAAQVVENAKLTSGGIQPYKESLFLQSVNPAVETIFSHGAIFFEFNEDADIALSPLADDTFDRYYITTASGTPKVSGLVSAVRTEYDLGVPAPTAALTGAVVARSTSSFTRNWQYFYEEPDGSQVDEGTLVEGVDITEDTVDKVFTLTSIPAKVTASTSAFLVIYFTGFDLDSNLLGTLYPAISRYSRQNTFSLSGATATAVFDINSSPVFTITYDTTNQSDFVLDRFYVYTFVSIFGEEGPPSPTSTVISVSPSEEVNLSTFESSVAGTRNIESIRIYRTVTNDGGDGGFFLVDTISFGTTTYTDSKTVSQVNTLVPLISTKWVPPPDTLRGIKVHPAGFLCGFSGNSLYLSEINQLHAFSTDNIISSEYPIVGIGISLDTIVVLTNGLNFSYTGQSPGTMVKDRYESRQSCVSKKSIVDWEGKVVYASPDGLVVAQGTASKLISEKFYRKEEWTALNPSTMFSAMHDGKLFAKTDNTFLIWDLEDGINGLTTTDQPAQALTTDLTNDRLLIADNSQMKAWDEGASNLTARVLSKEFQSPFRVQFTAAEIIADAYPVTLKIYTDSTLRMTKTVTDDKPFKLIPITPSKNWEFERSATARMVRIAVATSIRSLEVNQ